MLYADIPKDIYWQLLQNNAQTNGGQDPGHPGPPISYEDRLGVAKDLPLLTCRAEGYEYKGIAAAHQERTNASLREATTHIEARKKGRKNEFESKKRAAANQTRRTLNMGTDEEVLGRKTSSARKESSDSSKVRKRRAAQEKQEQGRARWACERQDTNNFDSEKAQR